MNKFLELLVSNTGRALIKSFRYSPNNWDSDRYYLRNTKTGAILWIANGAIYFQFETPGYLSFMDRYIVFYYAKKMINRKVEDQLTGVDKYGIYD